MNRTYSNFLLFENVLDSLTEGPDVIMAQAVNTLLNPIVTIIEEDCGTLIGNLVDTTFEIEGFVEVATGDPLTQARIITLLGQGQYLTGIRSLHTCLSHSGGGICRKCYEGSFLGSTAPTVGTKLSIKSIIQYQTDVIRGNGYSSVFPLSQTSDDYYSVVVINQGQVVDPSEYTLGYNYIQFPTILPINSTTGTYTVHFMDESTNPFQGYIAKTYSGGLLGMAILPTVNPLLRESLYNDQLSDSFLSLMADLLSKLSEIPSTHLEYVDRIHSKLEKVLYMLYLFAIYSNIQV
jgi:hypothetical protein